MFGLRRKAKAVEAVEAVEAVDVEAVRSEYARQRASFIARGGDPKRVPELPADGGLPFRTVGNFLYMSAGYDNW